MDIMISSMSNFKNLKKARVLVKDLDNIDKLLMLSHKALFPYRKYIPCKDILENIKNNHSLVQLYLKKYKKIVEKSGEIDG